MSRTTHFTTIKEAEENLSRSSQGPSGPFLLRAIFDERGLTGGLGCGNL
jgi:hypothetical protein